MTVHQVKEAHAKDLLNRQNVLGAGVGEKWVDGKPTGEPAVLVFVQKKMTTNGVLRKFSSAELVPQHLEGYPTDVIEVGRIRKQAFKDRVRPIKPGHSCGQQDITAGTIGGFFHDKDGDPVILSNNHVLANENRAKVGDIIYQPGPSDAHGGINFSGWTSPAGKLSYIATLKDFVKLVKSGNSQDSAIARIHDSLISSNLIDPIFPVVNRALAGFGTATIGMQVQKCGRTSGYSTGRIIGIHATFTIDYDFGPAVFDDCVVMSAMSQGGDSGSLICDMNMNAVALLFAGSPKVTIANPIATVRDRYGLNIWDGPTVKNTNINNVNWRIFTTDGSASFANGLLTVTENANQFCFAERSYNGNFKQAVCSINTGSDAGATWGPGIAVQWPTGFLKVNLRHNGSFGGAFNDSENVTIGATKPNTDYMVRIRKTGTSYVGEVRDGGRWYTVVEVPLSVFPMQPVSIRVGKTGLNGGSSDYAQDAGATGTCVIRDIRVD